MDYKYDEMVTKEFKPTSQLLKKYIKSFYFMKSRNHKKTEFIYYPHFIETINIFSNAVVSIDNQTFSVEEKPHFNTVILSANKTQFKTAIINNAYDIIGIQFFPLAIQHFFDISVFNAIGHGLFNINNNKQLNLLSQIKGTQERLEVLEAYLKSNFYHQPLEKLEKAVQLIHNSKGNIRMTQLEQQVNLSRRTILRQFKKHLHCSFEDYKNTVRFRLAIQNFSGIDQKTSNLIADIAYYDQADFINHFKALAGESPKKLLKHITNNPKFSNYFWKLKRNGG